MNVQTDIGHVVNVLASNKLGESRRSPERIQQSMQKWMAWFKDLAEKGHVKDQGHPLERAGKLVKAGTR
jgi:hypothetical protein